jgi:nuclear transport factor 2 (NTF2) superfamily protein
VNTKPTDIKPPFDEAKAKLKVKAAENAWNTCNPELVAQAYDSKWRNRTEFFAGREDIVEFLRRKWAKELDYRLMKELGVIQETAFLCVLNMNGEMLLIQINGCVMVTSIGIRDMSANDYPIKESERRYRR